MFRYDTQKDNNIDEKTWKIKYTSDNPLAEHAAQKISLSVNLPCIEELKFS